MSIRLYFDPEKVRKHPSYKEVTTRNGRGEPHTEYLLDGEGISIDDGDWYVNIYSVILPEIPNLYKGILASVSLCEDFPIRPLRERGVYRYKTATAELETRDFGRKEELKYIIKITGKSLKNVQELFQMVKAGSVRPEISYEGSQNGLSRQALEEEVERLRVIEDTLFQEREYHCELREKFRSIAGELRKLRWWALRPSNIKGFAQQIERLAG